MRSRPEQEKTTLKTPRFWYKLTTTVTVLSSISNSRPVFLRLCSNSFLLSYGKTNQQNYGEHSLCRDKQTCYTMTRLPNGPLLPKVADKSTLYITTISVPCTAFHLDYNSQYNNKNLVYLGIISSKCAGFLFEKNFTK